MAQWDVDRGLTVHFVRIQPPPPRLQNKTPLPPPPPRRCLIALSSRITSSSNTVDDLRRLVNGAVFCCGIHARLSEWKTVYKVYVMNGNNIYI